MAIIHLKTRLAASPDHVWSLTQRSGLLRHVAGPIVRFRAIDPPDWPEQWAPGRYKAAMYVFGFIPVGSQEIVISHGEPHPRAPAGARTLRDKGSGDLMKTWDHWIFITELGPRDTLYEDRVEVSAGLLTPGAIVFAWLFYAWRQMRWRGVIRRNLVF